MRLYTFLDSLKCMTLFRLDIYTQDSESYWTANDKDDVLSLFSVCKAMMHKWNWFSAPIFCVADSNANTVKTHQLDTGMFLIELEVPDDRVKCLSNERWRQVVHSFDYPEEFYCDKDFNFEEFIDSSIEPASETESVYEAVIPFVKMDWVRAIIPMKQFYEDNNLWEKARDCNLSINDILKTKEGFK